MGAVIKFKLLAPMDVDAMHKPTYLLSDLTHCIIEASLNTNGFSDFLMQERTVLQFWPYSTRAWGISRRVDALKALNFAAHVKPEIPSGGCG